MPIESEGIDALYTLRNLGVVGIKELEKYLTVLNPAVVSGTNIDLIALRDKLLQVYPIGDTQSIANDGQSATVQNSALIAVPGSHVLSVAGGNIITRLDSSTAALRHAVQLNVAVVNNLGIHIGAKCVPTVSGGVLTQIQILP